MVTKPVKQEQQKAEMLGKDTRAFKVPENGSRQ
jgi:hypothetical protein